MSKKIENGPGTIFLSQIIIPSIPIDNFDQKILTKVAQSLINLKFNLALPIVCLSDEEDKFILLTGLAIYEAARKSSVEQIWVFLIAEKQDEAEKIIEQLTLQSKLNERVIDSEDIREFLGFLNNQKSPLTSIRGIGEKYAKKIADNRPYKEEDIQKSKQSLNWLKAYKEWKTKN